MLLEFSVKTSRRNELNDITSLVDSSVTKSGVDAGIVIVYTPHTTAAVTINENADPSVRADIIGFLRKLIPVESGFSHMEGNSDAHIKSSMIGASEVIIVENGELVLGRWQGVYFCEFDGPRTRKVFIKIIPG